MLDKKEKRTLIVLQGLRGAAALLVVWDHALYTIADKLGRTVDLEFAARLGGLGVKIFFALSGFVMILSHGSDFGKEGARLNFSLKRIGRIAPLYWLTSLVYYLKIRISGENSPIIFLIISLFFVPNWFNLIEFGRPVYPLGWTLQYEMFFYLVFGCSLFFKKAVGIAILILIITALVIYRGWSDYDGMTIPLYYGDPIVVFFLVGVGVGLVRSRLNELLFGVGRRVDGGMSFYCSAFLVFLGVATGIAASKVIKNDFLLFLLEISIAFCCIYICSIAAEDNIHGGLGKIFVLLGGATYSIYLTHSFVLGPLGRLMNLFFPMVPVWFFVVLAIVFSIFLGWLVFSYIERPMLKIWLRMLRRLNFLG